MISSQPTYEELKRQLNLFKGCPATGSQPTYEELKHTYTPVILESTLGSQPTYEELKQISNRNIFLLNCQFSAYL